MLTEEKLILVRMSMSSEMSLGLSLTKTGIPVAAEDIRSFGWFGSTFFDIDDEGHVGLTAEGERLFRTDRVYVVMNARIVAQSAYLTERQAGIFAKASEEDYRLPEDGSDDMDALYLKRCDLVRYLPETDTLRAIPSGRLMFLENDSVPRHTADTADQALSTAMTDLGFAAMDESRRRKALRLAEKYMKPSAEYAHYPVYDRKKQEER